MTAVNREKSLPGERYDEKLFKQAYKAGLEAKELEKKSIRKKGILKFTAISLLSLAIVACLYVFIFLREEVPEYIESARGYEYESLYEIQDNFEVSPRGFTISTNNISADSAFVFNSSTGEVMFEKNVDEQRAIASITKLLSVMVALDTFDIEDSIDVNLENTPEDLEWTLKLEQGDRIKIDHLLKAMLLSSFNDTAYVLANAYPGGYNSFIGEMNKKAKSLRMESSSFDNPAGWDSEGNFSTARDIGKLVSAVLNYEYILDVVGKGTANISWNSGSELKNQTVYTTNQLYGVNKYIKGLKTGTTVMAKQCFVGYFVYDNGQEIITIVLGSQDRYGDTKKLDLLIRKVLE